MNGMSEPKLDAFQQSAYLAFLQEAKTKHKPIRIAFLEPSGGDEFKTVLQKLKNDGYAVFLINSEENHSFYTAEGRVETDSLCAYLRQVQGEDLPIAEYAEVMKQAAGTWRAAMIAMIERLGKKEFVSGLEEIEANEESKQSSSQPDFRFVLHFNKNTMGDDENYAKAQRECAEQIREFKMKCTAAYALKFRKEQGIHSDIPPEDVQRLTNSGEEFLQAVMDLRIGHDSNLEKGELYVNLTPNRSAKDLFISLVLNETCKRLGVGRKGLNHILVIADSSADLKAGVHTIAALADPGDPVHSVPAATFFIPKKSPINKVLQKLQNGVDGVNDEPEESDIDEEISTLPISKTKSAGQYKYNPTRDIHDLNKLREKIQKEKQMADVTLQQSQIEIIAAKEAYPTAQTPVESVLMYLNEKYQSN